MSDDNDLFANAMRGIRRLQSEPRRQTNGPHPGVHRINPKEQPSSTGLKDARPERSGDSRVLKANGISRDRLRQLANGRPPVDVEIDLHGMTREEVFSTLEHHIQQALTGHCRVLCLVHGRGLHSQKGRPVLKEAVYRWLEEGPFAGDVLAVIPKSGTRGGSCLVLLRRKR